MIGFLTNVAPIALGFIAKLFALKSQAAAENQKLMIQNLQVRNDSINQARDRADKDSPMAALNRRVIIFVILALIIYVITILFTQTQFRNLKGYSQNLIFQKKGILLCLLQRKLLLQILLLVAL